MSLLDPRCASHVLKIDTRNGSVELIGLLLTRGESCKHRRRCIFKLSASFKSACEGLPRSRMNACPGPDLGWAPDKYRAAVVATDGAARPKHSRGGLACSLVCARIRSN